MLPRWVFNSRFQSLQGLSPKQHPWNILINRQLSKLECTNVCSINTAMSQSCILLQLRISCCSMGTCLSFLFWCGAWQQHFLTARDPQHMTSEDKHVNVDVRCMRRHCDMAIVSVVGLSKRTDSFRCCQYSCSVHVPECLRVSHQLNTH